MTDRKRIDIKAILANPVLKAELHSRATDFICNFARVPSRVDFIDQKQTTTKECSSI
jgi:hypothetical protein